MLAKATTFPFVTRLPDSKPPQQIGQTAFDTFQATPKSLDAAAHLSNRAPIDLRRCFPHEQFIELSATRLFPFIEERRRVAGC